MPSGRVERNQRFGIVDKHSHSSPTASGPFVNPADKERPSEDLTGDISQPGKKQAAAPSAPDAADDAGFVPWEEASFDSVTPSTLGHRKIIRSRLVTEKGRRKIIPTLPADSSAHAGKAEIEPLLDDGEIVGVRVACSCGAVHEVRFEFSS